MEQIEQAFSAIMAAGLPVRITRCQQCVGGTIYRKDHWFQCPTCGALSTAFGGCFENLSPYGGSEGASDEWKELCAKSDEMLRNGPTNASGGIMPDRRHDGNYAGL